MKTLTTPCIILGHKNFGETDKFVFLYSEEIGKIKTIAKGARKLTSKFTGHLETLSTCTASLYFGPKNIILTEINTDKNFFRKRKNLHTISNALNLAGITNKILLENQTLENLTKLIKETLKILALSNKKELILIAYLIKLLDKTGAIPDFKETTSKEELTIPPVCGSRLMDKKYMKFFNFAKTEDLKKIESITLTKEESSYIKKLIKIIFHKTFDLKLPSLETFIIPATSDNLSKIKSN